MVGREKVFTGKRPDAARDIHSFIDFYFCLFLFTRTQKKRIWQLNYAMRTDVTVRSGRHLSLLTMMRMQSLVGRPIRPRWSCTIDLSPIQQRLRNVLQQRLRQQQHFRHLSFVHRIIDGQINSSTVSTALRSTVAVKSRSFKIPANCHLKIASLFQVIFKKKNNNTFHS